jgi:hypothetical protein
VLALRRAPDARSLSGVLGGRLLQGRVSMNSRTRVSLYCLASGVVGFWLNVVAVFVVVGSNGGSGLAPWFMSFVDVAYWPARLIGIERSNYFHPSLLTPIAINLCGWPALGAFVWLLHETVREARRSLLRAGRRPTSG